MRPQRGSSRFELNCPKGTKMGPTGWGGTEPGLAGHTFHWHPLAPSPVFWWTEQAHRGQALRAKGHSRTGLRTALTSRPQLSAGGQGKAGLVAVAAFRCAPLLAKCSLKSERFRAPPGFNPGECWASVLACPSLGSGRWGGGRCSGPPALSVVLGWLQPGLRDSFLEGEQGARGEGQQKDRLLLSFGTCAGKMAPGKVR